MSCAQDFIYNIEESKYPADVLLRTCTCLSLLSTKCYDNSVKNTLYLYSQKQFLNTKNPSCTLNLIYFLVEVVPQTKKSFNCFEIDREKTSDP